MHGVYVFLALAKSLHGAWRAFAWRSQSCGRSLSPCEARDDCSQSVRGSFTRHSWGVRWALAKRRDVCNMRGAHAVFAWCSHGDCVRVALSKTAQCSRKLSRAARELFIGRTKKVRVALEKHFFCRDIRGALNEHSLRACGFHASSNGRYGALS